MFVNILTKQFKLIYIYIVMISYLVVHTKHEGCYDRPIYEDKEERLRYITIRINPPKIFMFQDRDQAMTFFKEYIQDLDNPDDRCKNDDDLEHVPNCGCGVRDDYENPTFFYNKRNQVFFLENGPQVLLPPPKVKRQIDDLNTTNYLIRKAKILEKEYLTQKKELCKVCEECTFLSDSEDDEPVKKGPTKKS